MQHKVQTSNTLHNDIKTLLQNARNRVYTSINSTMTETYWQIGKRIVEEEQVWRGVVQNMGKRLD